MIATPEQRLAAGGLTEVPPSSLTLDPVTARSYQHPALSPRPVVRLCSERLGPGEDLALEFLGFQSPEVRTVGWQQPRGLGFPGWALVHDPARAGFALEVVKEFRAQTRLAGARPGQAKEGLDLIGERLGRAVPHFLPSFYEECGRVFLEAGNTNYAAQFFNKARQAEQVHALQVDEDQRREAFLEFALAGAVPVKTLNDYARQLQAAYPPEVAYSHFRELCLRRTLGGMPPWAAMMKDLARLAKPAGLDWAAEELELLDQILGSAALARAPIDFWVASRKAIGRLERRQLLLQLLPSFSGDSLAQGQTWLELLDSWGVLDQLQSGGAAAWLERITGHFAKYNSQLNPDALFPIVRRLAAALKAGPPLQLKTGYRGLDLDLLEQLCALDIPLSLTSPPLRLAAREWGLAGDQPTAERPKDPVHASRHPLLAALFLPALDTLAGVEPFESRSARSQGWRTARGRWLETMVERLEHEALPSLREVLTRWEKITTRELWTPYPELRQRLKQVAVGPLLARSLRVALVSELSWPALESALEELHPGASINCPPELGLDGWFPELVCTLGGRALAVGAAAVLARHDLVLPPGAKLERVRYLEGQFLVNYASARERRAYWSGDPSRSWLVSAYSASSLELNTVRQPGVGLSWGAKAIQPGDQDLPFPATLFHDGSSCWQLDQTLRPGPRLREFDPRTGTAGRLSLPRFLEEAVQIDQPLDLLCCSMFQLPEEVQDSPLGQQGRQAGFRLRANAQGTLSEGIDGRRLERPFPLRLAALLRLPGALADRPVTRVGHQNPTGCTIGSPDPARPHPISSVLDHPGAWQWRLSWRWWHLCQIRNQTDSLRLRQLTDSDGQRLLDRPGAALPDLENAGMRAGVQAVTQAARDLQQRLHLLVASLAGSSGGPTGQPIRPQQVAQLLGGLGLRVAFQDTADLQLEIATIEQLVASAPALAPPPGMLARAVGQLTSAFKPAAPAPPPLPVRPTRMVLPNTVGGSLGALGYLCSLDTQPADERTRMLELLDRWADSPLVAQGSSFRKLELKLSLKETVLSLSEGHSRFLLQRQGSVLGPLRGLEYSSDGQFRVPSGGELTSSQVCSSSWDTPERLHRLVALVRERGARPFQTGQIARLSKLTGLSHAEACFVWGGFPHLESYEANFLPAEVRELWGVKSNEARVARDNLRSLTPTIKMRLYLDALPPDPAELWDQPEAALERLAASWNKHVGRRQQAAPELLAVLSELKLPLKPPTMLKAISAPEASAFARDGNWKLGARGFAADGDVFTPEHLVAAVFYACRLFEVAPVGEFLRSQMPAIVKLVQDRMQSVNLVVPLGTHLMTIEASRHWLHLIGGNPIELAQQLGYLEGRDNGALLALQNAYSLQLSCRPAEIPDFEADSLIKAVLALSAEMRTTVCLQLIRSPGFGALIDRIQNTPVVVGGWEANPLASVPELVGRVQHKLQLSESAATLFLQTLTLAEPGIKQVQQWNGWSAPVYRKAAAELVEHGLVLEAKRARAGRSHFLPGGWEDLKAPNLPLESWKFPLYGLERSAGSLRVPLGIVLPLQPLHQLFEAAWARVEAGQGPAYEPV